MNVNLFVKLKKLNNNFCELDNIRDVKFKEEDIKEEYEKRKRISKFIPEEVRVKLPTYKEFRSEYYKTNVKIDGRKKRIYEKDIINSLIKEGVIKETEGVLYGEKYKLLK